MKRFTFFFALSLALLWLAVPADITRAAATITVTSSADDGTANAANCPSPDSCRLRDALAVAAAGDTINFAGDTTIRLASPLSLTRSVTIDGSGYSVVLSGDSDGDGTGQVRVIEVATGVTASLTHLRVERGSADNGGAIYNLGTLTLRDSTFSDNSSPCNGGAIYNDHGQLTVWNSTFSNNHADCTGGAIMNSSWNNQNAKVWVYNSTFSNNSAATGGGGIRTYFGALSVINSTFAGNSSTDYYIYPGGIDADQASVTVRNSIFAKGTAGPNCYFHFSTVAASNNLADDGSCGSGFTNSSTILLGPLGDYGGGTQTFPLLPGSPAINGTSSYCPSVDQRGQSRVGKCDIGAFESQGFALAKSGGDNQSAAIDAAFADPLALSVTANTSGEPVDGGQVTFTTPSSGAGATITGSPATITNSGVSVTATANGIVGSYTVTAASAGATSVGFALTNLCTSSSITVQNANDSGAGSLREAINQVCTSGTITFDADYTIPLASTLTLNRNVTIDGSGHTVVISGDSNGDGTGDVRVFLVNSGVTATLQNLTVTKGRSDSGGGIYSVGTLTVIGSTFSGNTAQGGNAEGGAILSYLGGALTVTNSTFVGNAASAGGAIYNYSGTATVTNSTFAGNSGSWGGAVGNNYNITLTNNTFSGNGGSTVYSEEVATVTLKNNILVHGSGANCETYSGYYPGYIIGSNNLADDTSCTTTAVYSTSILLGTLGDNGGPTQTIPLLPGSSAIDMGDDAICAAAPVNNLDQRGVARPIGAHCDVGAFEAAYTFSGAITVTSDADSGDGSLRQAMADIGPGGTITFDGDHTIHLASTLHLGRSMTIDGAGHHVVISGDTNDDGDTTPNVQILVVDGAATATLKNLTLEKGKSSNYGGGIFNYGTLTVANATFSGNFAYLQGGGILNYVGAVLTVTNSTFSSNSGGPYSSYGGGIYNYGTLTVAGSTFSGNSVSVAGGGIESGGTLTVTGSTFSDNRATRGAGINAEILPKGAGIATVTNSTFSGNSASGSGGPVWGGGIANSGTLTVANSTFSANSASSGAGGIHVAGTRPTTVTNSLFVKGATGANCYGTINTASNNLADDTSCGTTGFTNSPTISLGPLGSYGGNTQTIPLLPGSAAIDAGDDAACTAAPVSSLDQRGSRRPQGAHCDVGAFESQGFTLTKLGGDNQSAAVNTAFANAVTLTVTANVSGEPVNGGAITFTAPTSGASAAITGSPATIADGQASVTATANENMGQYEVTAGATGATPVAFHLTNKGDTTTVLTSSLNPSKYGDAVTFTAIVTINAPSIGDATGTVSFYELIPLGSGAPSFKSGTSGDAIPSGESATQLKPLAKDVRPSTKAPSQLQPGADTNAGAVAGQSYTFTTSSLPAGAHQVVAVYNGDALTSPSTSNVVAQTVNEPPVITAQPQSVTVNDGQQASFTAAASGSPAPTVQWQQSTDSGTTWSDIQGATSATFGLTANGSMTGYQYRAVFTNAAGSTTSNAATLTVSVVTGTGRIAGLVFNDANGNGTREKGEAGLSGWTVQLQDPNGSVLKTTATAADGSYSFTALPVGTFRVRVVLAASFVQTTANVADVTLANGQSVTGINIGAVVSADLKVTLTATYNANTKLIVYTLVVTNDGPANAAGVSLTDALPSGVSFVSVATTSGTCSGTKAITCNLGTLAAGSSATITLKVNRTNTRSAITNAASVTATTFDIDKGDNSATVTVR